MSDVESGDTNPRRRSSDVAIAQLTERLEGICERLEAVEKDLKDAYVTRLEFTPVRTLVYGAVGLMLTAIMSALVGLVVLKR